MGLLSTTAEYRAAYLAWKGIKDAPAPENRRRRDGLQAFESPLLEKYIGTAHWTLPGLWSIPAACYLIYLSVASDGHPPALIATRFLAGALAWSFCEYWIHRWLFHLAPSRSSLLRNVQFMLHGYHHEFPNDPRRLVAPPVLAAPLCLLLSLGVGAAFPTTWHPILAGLFMGYLAYDWVHYYTHHGRPTSRAAKFMRRFHQEHHYKSANIQFGLSSPLWDLVFFSYRRPTAPTKMERECLGDAAGG